MRAVFQVLSLDVLSKALLGAAGVAVIRLLPQEEYARYTVALALVAVAGETVLASFRYVYVVGYGKLDAAAPPGVFLTVQLLAVAAAVLLTLPLRDFAGGVYWVVVCVIVARALAEFAKGDYQRELKFFRYSAVDLLRALVLCLSLGALAYLAGAELKAWQVLLLDALAMVTIALLALRAGVALEGVGELGRARRLVVAIATGRYRYLAAYLILVALLTQLDVFLLKAMADQVTVATYGSAQRYYSLLSLALGAVHVVLLPMAQGVHSAADLDSLLGRYGKLALLFAAGVGLAAWAAQWFIPWVDRGRYPDAVAIFRILAASSVISFLFSPHVNLLMRFEDFKFLLALVLVALAVNVGLSLILIPALGGIGAAVATSTSFACLTGPIFLRTRGYRLALGQARASGSAEAGP